VMTPGTELCSKKDTDRLYQIMTEWNKYYKNTLAIKKPPKETCIDRLNLGESYFQ
jgi:hypothetical protein